LQRDIHVRYEPIKEIVVRDWARLTSPEDLARMVAVAAAGHAVSVSWAEGVAFAAYPLSGERFSKALIEEAKLYYAAIYFALMPNFHPVIETKDGIRVPVVNLSSSLVAKKIATWLKDRETR